VVWSIHARFRKQNRRWDIGRALPEPPKGSMREEREKWAFQNVSPDEARRRGTGVRDTVENKVDPTLKIREWVTGVSAGVPSGGFLLVAWYDLREEKG